MPLIKKTDEWALCGKRRTDKGNIRISDLAEFLGETREWVKAVAKRHGQVFYVPLKSRRGVGGTHSPVVSDVTARKVIVTVRACQQMLREQYERFDEMSYSSKAWRKKKVYYANFGVKTDQTKTMHLSKKGNAICLRHIAELEAIVNDS